MRLDSRVKVDSDMAASEFLIHDGPHMPVPRERDYARSGCSPFSSDQATGPPAKAVADKVRHLTFVMVENPCATVMPRYVRPSLESQCGGVIN